MIDHFSLNLGFNYFQDSHSSIIDYAKSYLCLLKNLYTLQKIFKSNLKNLDTYLSINKLYDIEKIDEILIGLEELSEVTDKILDSNKFKQWKNYPIWYATDKLEDANMSFQGLLASTQAHLSEDENFRWS